MLRKLFSDSVIYTIPILVSKSIGVLIIPIYTRILSVSEYGNLDLLLVIANLVNLVVAFEISQGVARFYSAEKKIKNRNLLVSSAFQFFIFCHFVFLAVISYFADSLTPILMGEDTDPLIFLLGIFYGTAHGLLLFVQNQFRWDLKSKTYAIISIITSIISTLLSLVFAIVLEYGLSGILLGLIVGNLIGILIGLFIQRKKFFGGFSYKFLRKLLAFSLPLVPSGLAVFFSAYLDRFMINAIVGVDAVGIYGVGFRIASVVGIITIGLRGAFMPTIYKHAQDENTPKQIATAFRLFAVGALSFSSVFILFPKFFVSILSTEDYLSASNVVPSLVLGIIFAQMYIFTPGMALAKKTSLILIINIVAVALNAFLNFLLIPKFGIHGASFATLCSGAVLFILNMISSQRLYFVPHEWFRLLIVFGFFLLLIGFVTVESYINIPESVLRILAFPLILVVIFAFKLVKNEEWRGALVFFKVLKS